MKNCIAIKFDKSRNSFKTERGSSNIYNDNCDLCNVIIVEPSLLSNRKATIIHGNQTFTFGGLLNHIRVDTNKPFIILCSLKLFNGKDAECKDFKELNELICAHIKKYGNSQYFFNSNIWIRFVEFTTNTNFLNEQLNRITKEFKDFKESGLYDLDSSKEVFEHSNRYFKHNYLRDIGNGGHSNFITPKLYPNELAFADQILSINTTSISHEEIEKFHDAAFRILLIDDKTDKADTIKKLMSAEVLEPLVGGKLEMLEKTQGNERAKELLKDYGIARNIENLEKWIINNQKNNEQQRDELKKLLENIEAQEKKIITGSIATNSEASENTQGVQGLISYLKKCNHCSYADYVNNRLIWNTNTKKIESYYFSTDKDIRGAIEKKEKERFFDIDRHISSSCNQIVQVTNLTDAIVLLADHRIRFDLIMMDYLLDKKDENDNDRELATNFFLWFQDKHCENGEVDYLRKKLKNLQNSQKKYPYLPQDSDLKDFNRALRELVKGNRGPLKKFWFFPITAFNSTFIDDLVHNHVRLIDYYWHISKGADPITTPYTFLSLLNKFFYLQLENSVFLQSEIIRFLRSTIDRLQEVNNYNDFVAVMGNDYASFVVKFMSRPNFYRDRTTSLFSDYVWNEFYKKGEYETLHVLVNYAHKFYHRCAFGTKDDYTKIVIFLRDMKMYIDEYFPEWNRRGDHYVDMTRLSDSVDKCFGKQ